MFCRYIVPGVLVVSMLIMAGCDMEQLVRSKVPEPLKKVLSFGPQGSKRPKGEVRRLRPTDIDIVSPREKSVHPVDKPMEFRALVRFQPEPGEDIPQVSWTLFSEKDKKGASIGTGNSARRKLDPGDYRVELRVTMGKQRIVRNVNFRAAHGVKGVVSDADGSGLAGAEIALTDLESGKEVARTSTGKGGNFAIESPAAGLFLMTPTKPGYSFSPLESIVKFGGEAVQPKFVGFMAEIKDIRLTRSLDSDEADQSVCPHQQAYLKFSVTSEIKPTHMEACLERIEQGATRRFNLEVIGEEKAGDKTFDPPGPVFKVQIPLGLASEPENVTYRLVVTVTDAKERSFSSKAKNRFTYDGVGCFRRCLDQAVAHHEKGQLEDAIKAYKVVEELYKRVERPERFLPFAEKSRFDQGLAYLGLALPLKPEDPIRVIRLQMAIADFNKILKHRKNDMEVLLFRGIARQVMGNYPAALSDFNAVLAIDPNQAAALELRGQTYVKTEQDQNLLLAVDDFTRALAQSPGEEGLRKSRRETLKFFLKLEKEKKERKEEEEREKREAKPKQEAKDKKKADLTTPTDEKDAKDKSVEKAPKEDKSGFANIPLREISDFLKLEKYLRT